MFEYMLSEEKVRPEKLAYDRPSPKLIGFLRKHYGLADYVSQSNNFVIFKQYFSSSKETVTDENSINQNQVNSLKNGSFTSTIKTLPQTNLDTSSPAKKVVQYNPITNKYTEFELSETNNLRRTGKKIILK